MQLPMKQLPGLERELHRQGAGSCRMCLWKTLTLSPSSEVLEDLDLLQAELALC